MTPYFSLILPCYNVEKYLERCVQSILSQSFTDYEIILVDDGSTDQTPALCDALALKNACIRVIHQDNKGLSSARNAGLAVATGKYIWFIDPDDWIEPDALTILHEASMDGSPDVVKFNYYRVCGETKPVIGCVLPGWYQGEQQIDQLRCEAFRAAEGYVLSAWSHVYDRMFLKKNRLFFVSERRVCSEDYLFTLQAALRMESVRVIAQHLYRYELRQGSLSHLYKPDLFERYVELVRQLKAYYQAHQALDKYQALIERFYLWHLMRISIGQEYCMILAGGEERPARETARRILRMKQTRQAVRKGDRKGLSMKKRIQLCAVVLGFEPMFYWLYVVRPRHKGK